MVAHRLVPLRGLDVEEIRGLVRVERLRKATGDLRGAHRARGVVVAPPFADKKVEQRAKRRQAPLDRAPGEPAPVAPGREPLDLHPGERRPAGLPRRREVVRRRRQVPAIGIAGVRREPPLVGEVAHERVDRLHPGREGRFHAGRGGGSRAHRGPFLHASVLRPARRRQPTGQVIRTARPAATGAVGGPGPPARGQGPFFRGSCNPLQKEPASGRLLPEHPEPPSSSGTAQPVPVRHPSAADFFPIRGGRVAHRHRRQARTPGFAGGTGPPARGWLRVRCGGRDRPPGTPRSAVGARCRYSARAG